MCLQLTTGTTSGQPGSRCQGESGIRETTGREVASQGEVSRDGSLGISTKSASPEGPAPDRWTLQNYAARLLPQERVAKCCRGTLASGVTVVHHPDRQAASFAGIQTCGSVWACPVCATKISERRREELAAAVAEWTRRGGKVVLVTYTIRHKRKDDLRESLEGMLRARRAAKSGKGAKQLNERFGVVGSVRALEVTHGRNGWHPHLHELLFVAGWVDEVQLLAAIRLRWADMVGRAGLRDVNEHGVDVQLADMTVGEYVAKFGRERSWSESHELAKAAVKRGKRGNRSPVGLLADYGAGERAAGALWAEYARVFKGRRQLVWSSGLRELLGLGPQVSDEELAAEEREDGVPLVFIPNREWRVVIRNDARAHVLEVAKTGDAAAVRWLLHVIGCVGFGPASADVEYPPGQADDPACNAGAGAAECYE